MELALPKHAQCTFVRNFAWFCFVLFLFCLPTHELLSVIVKTHHMPQIYVIFGGGRVLIHYLGQMPASSASHLPFCTLGHRKVIQARIINYDPLTLDLHLTMPRNRERGFTMAVVEASSVQEPGSRCSRGNGAEWSPEPSKRDSSSAWRQRL